MRFERDWRAKVKDLVESEMIPDRWTSEASLAEWLQSIDPYLLMHTPAKVHQLLGRRKNGKWVLPLPTAQRLMLNQIWENEKKQRLQSVFGDDLKRLGKKAMMQLERGIDEMNITCIQMALEMAAIWQKGFKVTHIDGEKQSKQIFKLFKEYKKFTGKDVESIKDNH